MDHMEPENSVFEQANEPSSEEETFLARYVGPGKKFANEEELAKAYENADRHIPQLNNDLKDMRAFMTAQFEQIAQREIETPTGPKVIVEEPQPAPAPTPKADDGDEDLTTRIAKALEERDETKRLQTNAEFAQEVMIEQFGSQEAAVKAVRDKARDLGVNPQFLADTAFRSPKALFGIMGIDPESRPKSHSTPAPSSDVNPRILDSLDRGPKPKTYAFHEQVRRSDPKLYATVAYQQQLMKDAMELGSDFYKR